MARFTRHVQVRWYILAAIAAGLDCRRARGPGKRPCYSAFDFIAFGVDKQLFCGLRNTCKSGWRRGK